PGNQPRHSPTQRQRRGRPGQPGEDGKERLAAQPRANERDPGGPGSRGGGTGGLLLPRLDGLAGELLEGVLGGLAELLVAAGLPVLQDGAEGGDGGLVLGFGDGAERGGGLGADVLIVHPALGLLARLRLVLAVDDVGEYADGAAGL